VTLSPLLDSFGVPRPQMHFATEPYTRNAFPPALAAIATLFRALHITTTSEDRDPTNYSGAGHIMGTCRMGTDAESAVVDRDCRSFDHRNLYIVGGSTFPTCGTANPTLTIAALALRAAGHVLATLPQMPAAPARQP
jgi:choline dehydrogenase-like flavoprotein